jgi:glutamine---fructose-6-phosphate transaminase (isomerizing)
MGGGAYPNRVSEVPAPTLRDAPPWAMQEMIEAQPKLAVTIAADRVAVESLAAAIREASAGPASVAVVGCGSSEHAALAGAALLDRALAEPGAPRGRVVARQAFEAMLEPPPAQLVLGISHEAETPATIAALEAGWQTGARTALITANPAGPAAVNADQVLVTPVLDRSWCHTVGYLSPVLALGAVAHLLAGSAQDADDLARYLQACLGLGTAAREVADRLGEVDRFVVCGSGVDHGSARELALKIEEGVRLPAVGRDTETELHGHLVSASASCGLIAIAADPWVTGPRAARSGQLLLAAQRLGLRTAAIVSPEADALLPPKAATAGRLVLPAVQGGTDVSVRTTLAALAGAAVALQLLTLGLVMRAGTNPDRIGRENADQADAAAIVSASFPVPSEARLRREARG